MRVLVVEDVRTVAAFIESALSYAGMDVECVSTGQAALARRELFQPDIVLIDLALPDMDGLAFVTRIRTQGPWTHLPVIALTGLSQPAQIEAGRDAGFTDYVRKFERDALLTSLRQCLTAPTDTSLVA